MRSILIFIFSLIICFTSYGEEKRALIVDEISVECGISITCDRYRGVLSSYIGTYHDVDNIVDRIEKILYEDNIYNFLYEIMLKPDGRYLLNFSFDIRKIISKVSVEYQGEFAIDEINIKPSLKFSIGEEYFEDDVTASLPALKKLFEEKGFTVNELSYEPIIYDNQIEVAFFVTLGKPILLEEVEVAGKGKQLYNLVKNQVLDILDKPWDPVKFNFKISGIKQLLFNRGYYFSEVKVVNEKRVGNSIIPQVEIFVGPRHSFGFIGNKIFSHQELLKHLKSLVSQYRNELNINFFKKSIEQYYENHGIYHSRVLIEEMKDSNHRNQVDEIRYFIHIKEGYKLRVKNVEIKGSNYFTEDWIKQLYDEKGSVLAKRKFFDKKYVENFPNFIKEEYHKRGFIFLNVFKPRIVFSRNKKDVSLYFRVNENIQSLLTEIKFEGLKPELEPILRDLLVNKENYPLNTVDLAKDFDKIVTYLKSIGYYFAKIENLNSKDIVQYSEDYKTARLLIKVDAKEIIRLKDIIISGLEKTREKVVKREIFMTKGDLITPKEIQNISDSLSSLGLFSKVSIRVLDRKNDRSDYDMLISLKERDFGFFEIAPGFRTDIGMKFSSSYGYNNLWGMNRSATVKGQVNQRLNFDTLDARRRGDRKRRLEYDMRFKFTEPYIFNLPLAFEATLSNSERRFFSFDATITRVGVLLSKTFSDVFSSSLKYQFEYINQFDATDSLDEGDFRIGGVTPAITLDFRNNRINPTRGSFFTLSSEFANPSFASQNKDELEINFYKIVSRNRFYFPMPFGSLAVSFSAGRQVNLAKARGFIPKIKVFRLNGLDLVRGFDDDEINRLASGIDISNLTIRNKAYFTNFKIEPRYFLNDEFIIGFFLDGGKVYVGDFNPLEFRSSVGVSFKYLTPVGSIDFDYGFKLHRKRVDNGILESPGRFHLSIGFF